jgi:MFS family permease
MLNALALGALPVTTVILGRALHHPGGGATLIMALGLGGLAGSALVTAVPLRGEPERLAIRLFAAMAIATAGCALAPSFGFFLAGFALIGVATAVAFTATLAARAKYAPESARAQVFVTSAGLKIALASVGSAVAGVAAGLGGRTLLLVAAAITGVGVLAAVADRTVSARSAGARGGSTGRSRTTASP